MRSGRGDDRVRFAGIPSEIGDRGRSSPHLARHADLIEHGQTAGAGPAAMQ
jgi:hypothetical protein